MNAKLRQPFGDLRHGDPSIRGRDGEGQAKHLGERLRRLGETAGQVLPVKSLLFPWKLNQADGDVAIGFPRIARHGFPVPLILGVEILDSRRCSQHVCRRQIGEEVVAFSIDSRVDMMANLQGFGLQHQFGLIGGGADP